MFYLTTHSIHFYLRLSGVKDHSDFERGNPLSPLHSYSFRLAARVLLYAERDVAQR